MTLGDYLSYAMKRPWKWGEHDCCAFPAGWAGVTIPAYSSASEGEALIERAGGLTALIASFVQPRLQRVDTPHEGDIGVILTVGMDRKAAEVAAICTGERWAFASPRGGVAFAPAIALAVWRA